MQTIGIGLSHTGNRNLADALEILYKEKFDTYQEVVEGRLDDWLRAVDHMKSLKDPSLVVGLLEESRYFVGYPACFFYEQILAKYPKVKFIMTTIDEDVWCEAMQPLIKSLYVPEIIEAAPENAKSPAELLKTERREVKGKALLLLEKILSIYMPEMSEFDLDDDSNLRILYRKHHRQVVEKIQADNLLVLNNPDDWAALCSYLGMPEPADEDYPYGSYSPERIPSSNEMHQVPKDFFEQTMDHHDSSNGKNSQDGVRKARIVGIALITIGVIGYFVYKRLSK